MLYMHEVRIWRVLDGSIREGLEHLLGSTTVQNRLRSKISIVRVDRGNGVIRKPTGDCPHDQVAYDSGSLVLMLNPSVLESLLLEPFFFSNHICGRENFQGWLELAVKARVRIHARYRRELHTYARSPHLRISIT